MEVVENSARRECYACKKWGHFAYECYNNKGKQKKKDESQMHKVIVMIRILDHVLLMVTISDCAKFDLWYLDIRCSNHMTKNKGTITAKGMRKVLIHRRDGHQSFIIDVLYMPQMKTNLLSLDQLLEKGHVMNMEHNMMKVYNSKRKLILKTPLSKSKAFKIGIQSGESRCLVAVVEDQNWVWHLRFWNLNFKSLSLLKKKLVVHGFPSINPLKELCEGCLISKLTKSSFKSNVSATKALLQIVYSDVCGPMELEVMVYLIKRKGEAFVVFKRFKVMMKKQCGQSIKILRTDGGGEYTSHDFHSYCDKGGIIHEVFVPYTHQHNGKAERRNRTLMNMAQYMPKDKNMPKQFGGNLSLIKNLNDVTPKEVWSGRKSAISHFQVFGSLCFEHLPDERRKKFDDKGQPMIFLGKKLVLSKDVVVDERKGWRWETITENGKVTISIQLNMQSENCVEIVQVQPCRPQRTRQPPERFGDYTSIPDFKLTEERDMMHLTLLVETELVPFEQAIREPE
ncbi:hypothetical protein CR513_42676, partial [Mucuna pruriens]